MDFDPAEFAYVPTTGVRRAHETPLLAASNHSLEGYGCLVDAPESFLLRSSVGRLKAGDPSMRIRAIRAVRGRSVRILVER
jgi:hypothetical protein